MAWHTIAMPRQLHRPGAATHAAEKIAEASRASGGAEATHQLGSDAGNVAGAKGQDHVTGPELLQDSLPHLRAGRLEPGIGSCQLGGVSYLATTDPCDGLLAGRINLGYKHQIGGCECLTQDRPVSGGAGIQMRLKDRDQP